MPLKTCLGLPPCDTGMAPLLWILSACWDTVLSCDVTQSCRVAQARTDRVDTVPACSRNSVACALRSSTSRRSPPCTAPCTAPARCGPWGLPLRPQTRRRPQSAARAACSSAAPIALASDSRTTPVLLPCTGDQARQQGGPAAVHPDERRAAPAVAAQGAAGDARPSSLRRARRRPRHAAACTVAVTAAQPAGPPLRLGMSRQRGSPAPGLQAGFDAELAVSAA